MIKIAKKIIKKNAALSPFFRYMQESLNFRKKPVSTPMGFLMTGDKFMTSGTFEPEETRIVRDLVRDADRFINVGANIGYYCCIALSKGKKVIAFEPMQRNLQCLYKNITINGWENDIEIYPVALGERAGLIEIYGGGTVASLVKGWSGTPESYRNWVPISTFDLLIGGRFKDEKCVVLVDVEGAELGMLRGALEFLRRDPKPVWIVEISIDEHLPDGVRLNLNLLETFSVFWDAGYDSYEAGGGNSKVTKEIVSEIVRTGTNTLKTHNFIFRSVE